MNYNQLKDYRNSNNMFAVYNGIQIDHIEEGKAISSMTVTKNSYNPVGSVHGGAMFTLSDVAAGGAASSFGEHVTTLDSSFHFLKAGINTEKITATATVKKRGKRVIVINVEVTDQDNVLLCEGIFTFMSLGKGIDTNTLSS